MDRYNIRLHGLGGQGLKSMIQEILAPLLSSAGFRVQAFPFFGGERRGAPVAGYLRFGEKEIVTRSFIAAPDMVVIFGVDKQTKMETFLNGLAHRSILLINADAFLPEFKSEMALDVYTYVVNANDISLACGIGRAGDPYAVINTVMAGAIIKILEQELQHVFPIDNAYEIIKRVIPRKQEENCKAFLRGLQLVRHTRKGITDKKNASLISQPDERCTKCHLCYLFCPKRAIEIMPDKTYRIREEACNYCGVCIEICPLNAIAFLSQTETRKEVAT